jgi:hypothetical protein
VDREIEAHPGRRGEYVRGVSGEDRPACPVVVDDGGGHLEGADVGDLNGQVRDPGGGPDEGRAPFLAEVVEALAPFGVPWYAADPAVGGICGDEHAAGGGVTDAVDQAGPLAGVVAQRRAEQDADPVAEGAGPGGGDPGRLAHRAVRAVGADDVACPDGGGRARRCRDGGQHFLAGRMQAGEFGAVARPGSGGGSALGEDGFKVVLRARPHVASASTSPRKAAPQPRPAKWRCARSNRRYRRCSAPSTTRLRRNLAAIAELNLPMTTG